MPDKKPIFSIYNYKKTTKIKQKLMNEFQNMAENTYLSQKASKNTLYLLKNPKLKFPNFACG